MIMQLQFLCIHSSVDLHYGMIPIEDENDEDLFAHKEMQQTVNVKVIVTRE